MGRQPCLVWKEPDGLTLHGWSFFLLKIVPVTSLEKSSLTSQNKVSTKECHLSIYSLYLYQKKGS